MRHSVEEPCPPERCWPCTGLPAVSFLSKEMFVGSVGASSPCRGFLLAALGGETLHAVSVSVGCGQGVLGCQLSEPHGWKAHQPLSSEGLAE